MTSRFLFASPKNFFSPHNLLKLLMSSQHRIVNIYSFFCCFRIQWRVLITLRPKSLCPFFGSFTVARIRRPILTSAALTLKGRRNLASADRDNCCCSPHWEEKKNNKKSESTSILDVSVIISAVIFRLTIAFYLQLS